MDNEDFGKPYFAIIDLKIPAQTAVSAEGFIYNLDHDIKGPVIALTAMIYESMLIYPDFKEAVCLAYERLKSES